MRDAVGTAAWGGFLKRMTRREAQSAFSDEALAERVRATGDTDAFALLVSRYRARLIALARRMLTERLGADEAEDAAQEAFVAAYAKRHTYRSPMPFRPWLYRIALNRCLDRLRSQARRPQTENWEQSAQDAAAPSATPLQALLGGEQEARMQAAVAALPAKYRMVFLLRHLDELSYEEIALATDQPVGTVKTHLFRARALLREALTDFWEDDQP